MNHYNNTGICRGCRDVKYSEENLAENLSETNISNNKSNTSTSFEDLWSHLEVNTRPSILTIQNEWNIHPSTEVYNKSLKFNTETINNFINSLEVPSWYRGVSDFQRQAAENLLSAIHDDCAQSTVYRTMRCLESLGLDPLPTKKQLRKILPLCGGSDLALLWFLMEWLYREHNSESYNVNEQLILSSIAHLDLHATIHELDRILPPKQDFTPEMCPARKNKLQNKPAQNKKQKKEIIILPYFQKLPQRMPIKQKCGPSQNFALKPMELQLMSEDNNRSFQGFIFDSKEIGTQNFTKEKIDKHIRDFEAAPFEAKKDQVRNQRIKAINYLKHSFDVQLNAIIKKKTQDLQKAFGRKQQSYKRIFSRFQNQVEKFRYELHTKTESCQKLLTGSICDHQASKCSPSYLTTEDGKQCIFSQNSSLCDFEFKPSEKSSESSYLSSYFENQQLPYKFDYFKIFAWQKENSEDLNICTDFLNVDQKQTPMKKYSGADDSNEIGSCIHEIFQQSLMENKVINLITNTTTTTTTTTTATTTTKEKANRNVVDYGLDYYDPEDDELMDRMLEDALGIMKRNPKFVCASIPAAHRLPTLREWIRSRYGKTFNNVNFSMCYPKVRPILKALAKVSLPVELPSTLDMGKNLTINYSFHDYVIKKSENIRNNFYKRIDKELLAQSRVLYLALRPFLFCKTKPKFSNTIFAYMPAHRRENYHFRPWKLGETMRKKVLSSRVVVPGSLKISSKKLARPKS